MAIQHLSRAALIAVCFCLGLPAPSEAIQRCGVKIARDGAVELSATGVIGTLKWGESAGEETRDLVDPGGCLLPGRARKCLIAPAGTLESKTPPSTCEIHFADLTQETCSTWIRGCTPGVRGSSSTTGAIYRWAVYSSYGQAFARWYGDNNADLFGGVAPQVWGDNNGVASQLSSDKELLRALFARKGYGGMNATVVADEWYASSSTNSKHAAVLFRIRNTTQNDIVWDVDVYQTAYGGWNEYASVALNGVSVWTSAGAHLGPNTSQSHSLTIPADRTSTAIFIASSNSQNGTRSLFLAFHNDTLDLSAGLAYVDDLATASGGWDE
jgi:hypothetical protein